ncbi:absent in melanoma 1-like protein [Gigaspora margarita]|uniref:Absent in melanoma 1-like protein n=1 Tax=Gigaspora margarita TaxID=4874 RepID=A0A8H3WXL5_GIGMA|nr:absent in melanoma 1-like protein [Gigaspora margarita]
MKRVLIPLFLHETESCCDCQPGQFFRADWCLDLHGFLSREEFAARLDQINNHVKGVELMTRKTKSLLYSISSVITVLLIVILSILKPKYGWLIGVILSSVGYFFAKYMIEKNASERAIAFTNLLNNLFARYNEKENPTVNWKFWWVTSYNNYANNRNGRAFGNGQINVLNIGCSLGLRLAAVFTDNALIILEINDALSDITANTVRVNIAPDTHNSNGMTVINTFPVNNIPDNNVPINSTHVINMK